MKNIVKTALFFVPFLLVSCSSGSDEPETTYTLTISDSSITLMEESTYQLSAESSRKGSLIFWSMLDESVATVSDEGLVTAVREGSTICYAKCGKETAACSVTVTPYTADGEFAITLDKTSFTLYAGDVFTLPLNAKCGSETVTPASYSYEISDPSVFSGEGNAITALKAGTASAVLTATYGNSTDSVAFEVTVY